MRVLRTAAGRRALQLAVLVGGLFALGFLSGEQAHAADGTPSVTSSATAPSVRSVPADGLRALTQGVTNGVADAVEHALPQAPARTEAATPPSPGRPAASTAPARHLTAPHAPVLHEPAAQEPAPDDQASEAPQQSQRSATQDTEPQGSATLDAEPRDYEPQGSLAQVTQNVVRSVTGGVVKPVGDLVGTVTRSLDEALAAATPPLSDVPLLPGTGSTVPLPGLPGLPGLRGLSEVPGTLLPAPVTALPASTQPGGVPAAADSTTGTKGRTAHGTTTAAHEPVISPAVPAPGAAAQLRGHRAAPHGYAPTQPAPIGDPDGALGGQSAVDNGGSRHIDAHAVTLNDRAPLRLVPGAAARVDAPGTQDRHRDIPVFPG
ncbi:hypothetical protein GCM10010121_033980 [Streptomyces brasiliensis]|uniref:Uncharacterized protein n=1 Tax=Streptomyces brasiliensis TaxID=1954 RepID=A0A917NR23_9ACTN|nr:hypothetical protein GCM10010121_033980 [Streptomyces brasiliensis]